MNTIKTLFFLTLGLGQLSAFAQWETVYIPFTGHDYLPNLNAGKFVDRLTGIAVGRDNDGPIIVRTKDGGTNWDTVYHDTTKPFLDFYDMHFLNDSTAIAVGSSGWNKNTSFIATTNDLGDSWKVEYFPRAGFYKMFFPSASTGYIVGRRGILHKTTNGGKNWNDISLASKSDLWSVHFTSDTVGYVTTQDTVFKTIDGGLNWT